MRKFQIAAAVAFSLASAAPVWAADLPSTKELAPPPPVVETPNWHYQVSIYGFMTSIGGNVGVGRLPAASVDIPFGKVLDHLQGIFAGSAVARNDQFYFSIDGMWAKIGANGTGPVLGTRTSLGLQLGFVTGYAGYRLPIGSPDFDLYGTVGGRYMGLSASLGLSNPPLNFSRHYSQSVDWADPLVGLAMHYRLNDKWFMDATADIGGFDVGSKLTSQDQVMIGYNWTQSISTAVGYRGLYADYQQANGNGGSFRYKTWLYGPYVNISYNF